MVHLIAMGSGKHTLTAGAAEALEQADLLVGAARLLEAAGESPAPRRALVRAGEILQAVRQAQEPCVLYSGDTGFYSGAAGLVPLLQREGLPFRVYPGLSSVQMLAARLGEPWQDWKLVSAHGLDCDPVTHVTGDKSVFFLTGGQQSPAALCAELTRAGLGALPCAAAENLFLPGEKVTEGTAAELARRDFGPLAVLLARPAPRPFREYGWGIPDEAFERGGVPMTKQAVRAAALYALRPGPDSLCWDVGAGTGSVAVTLARVTRSRVYAVECAPEACALIEKNREKFGAWNLTVVQGRAPEALADLPAPDCVFVGGTKGEMLPVLRAALDKNPAARVVVTAIALETLQKALGAFEALGMEPQVSQIFAAEAKAAGSLHLMMGQNPVFVLAAGGGL